MRECEVFNGDNRLLIESIRALLRLDAAGAIVPHGVGGHARTLLTAAANRLERALAAQCGEPVAWQQRRQIAPGCWTAWADCEKWAHDSIVQNKLTHTQARALYAAAAPSQPVALPPERKIAPIYGDEPIGEQQRAWDYNEGWNACRAAMLAAAPAGEGVGNG